jgi:regulation of enolase protein 1 (concanavalin A-like superfamily)
MENFMYWYNEPPNWEIKDNVITVNSAAKTDFWRETHYGFIRDNGHFFYAQVEGDFIAEVKVTGNYKDLYDQAGLMLRLDERNWLKCGIEFVDGIQQVSAVITRDYSDWSVVPLPQNPAAIWIRLSRRGTAVEVEYSVNGTEYFMLRLGYLTAEKTINVGMMCASPEGNGFSTKFEKFQIRGL